MKVGQITLNGLTDYVASYETTQTRVRAAKSERAPAKTRPLLAIQDGLEDSDGVGIGD